MNIDIDKTFIKEIAVYKNEIFEKIKGLVRFPMRVHPRPLSEEAQKHEAYVSKRFVLGKNNLFAFSIDPGSYHGVEEYLTDFILYRFLILNEPINVALVKDIIGSNIIDLFVKSKICYLLPDKTIQASYRIIPFHGKLFITDRYNAMNDMMVYLSYDSLLFCEHLITSIDKNTVISSVLDICCGSGIIGLTIGSLIKHFSPMIDGIDINPRAIELSKVNALLNNVVNTSFFVNDLNELKKNENQFYNLIVFNPPFVLMPPDNKILHSYGGELGIEYSMSILHIIDQKIRLNTKCFGIVASPVLYGNKIPILMEKAKRFKNLKIQLKLIGEYPPIERYKEYYERSGVETICQMIITVEQGSGITIIRDADYMLAHCFA